MRCTPRPAQGTRYPRLLALALLALVSRPLRTHAANFTVDDTGEASDATPGDGVCATAGAVCTLRAAMEEANALAGSDQIALPAGTFVTNAQLPDVTTNITITGAGSAQSIVQAGAGHPQLFNVTSTGHLSLNMLQLTNAHRAVGSTDGPVAIDACLVTGNSAFPAIDVGGSGSATVTYTITNSTLSNNTANVGAALAVNFGSLVATNVTFSGNTAPSGGGAVYLHGSAAYHHQFQNCHFTGNAAPNGSAILTDGGPLNIDTSTFSNNTADGVYAGALATNATSTTITDSTFDSNHGTSGNPSGSLGGAVMISNQVTALRVTFSNNDTTGQGGAVFAGANTPAQLDCNDCTFSGNTAAQGGGAVATGNGSGLVRLASSTVTANTAATGGGLFAGAANGIRIKNTIVAGNTNAGAPDCTGAGISSSDYNLIGDGTGCTIAARTGDQIGSSGSPIDPGLGPLANNGGTIKTHALLATSPAGEAGNPAGCTDFTATAIVTDGRNESRVVDGNNDGTARCDIGAVEAPAGTFPTPSTTTTLPGATTTTSSTVTGATTTTTTSTTLPPVCVGGTTISKAMLTVKKLGDPAGNEGVVMKGTLDFPAGTPAVVDPSTKGAQLLIEDLGSGSAAVFNLTYLATAVPPGAPGAGCNAKDGWKKLAYKNVSGALDPPTCTAKSADGLTALRFKDKRAKSKGIAFTAKAKNAQLPVLVGPARITVVLGGTVTESQAGECGIHAFEAGSCKRKKTTLVCK